MSYLNNPQLSEVKLKVLNSALHLFVEKGYFNTSIPDLVKHSGVSTGSIYHGFKDKQSIAEELMAQLLWQIEGEQNAVLAPEKDAWQQYYDLCRWLLETAQNHPHVSQFALRAQHKEFMPELAPICSSKPFIRLREVLERGMQQGLIREMNPMIAAASAYGGVLRLIQLSLDQMLSQPPLEYLDEITETCWRSVAADTEK
ncbi:MULTISPECIES: TetR/AcrR family transcriptional regulator [Thiomicrorhabdus]|uniref:TetR/AcrR family transcriptional regulator n=1 Tax=Thiomicrorhabdus heinhorstiae TaxID=2748010 RepID=A0ABS0C042_9GAMM|nr:MULTISPECIES: TetR/AcrR family transcriptional regulator [Thiomicrorhabdus]MBF6058703.1 TetR/AcrR family transcriptional regulator [Thiomicrorhabdus heinhorstiae]